MIKIDIISSKKIKYSYNSFKIQKMHSWNNIIKTLLDYEHIFIGFLFMSGFVKNIILTFLKFYDNLTELRTWEFDYYGVK